MIGFKFRIPAKMFDKGLGSPLRLGRKGRLFFNNCTKINQLCNPGY